MRKRSRRASSLAENLVTKTGRFLTGRGLKRIVSRVSEWKSVVPCGTALFVIGNKSGQAILQGKNTCNPFVFKRICVVIQEVVNES